jgi:hypothetical protein
MWFALAQPPYGTSMPQSGRRPQHQKQTSRPEIPMSALPPKADIAEHDQDVRFVPEVEVAAISRCTDARAARRKFAISERVPSGTVGELKPAEIGSKPQTDP